MASLYVALWNTNVAATMAQKLAKQKQNSCHSCRKCLGKNTAQKWWDSETNGKLVISVNPSPLTWRDEGVVQEMLGHFALDAMVTQDEVNARGHVFAVSVQSLIGESNKLGDINSDIRAHPLMIFSFLFPGVFHKSNLITFLPRYIFKKELQLVWFILTTTLHHCLPPLILHPSL